MRFTNSKIKWKNIDKNQWCVSIDFSNAFCSLMPSIHLGFILLHISNFLQQPAPPPPHSHANQCIERPILNSFQIGVVAWALSTMGSRTRWNESIRQRRIGCAIKIAAHQCDVQPDVSPQTIQSNSVVANTTMIQSLNHSFDPSVLPSVQIIFSSFFLLNIKKLERNVKKKKEYENKYRIMLNQSLFLLIPRKMCDECILFEWNWNITQWILTHETSFSGVIFCIF